MTSVPLGDARDRLSEIVFAIERTGERVAITRRGAAVAVLISADELASLEETVELLGKRASREAIEEGLRDAEAGRFVDNEQLTARYGIA